MRGISVYLPRNALLTTYKSFIRPYHLDYFSILYDKNINEKFLNKLEKVQFKACLGITDRCKEDLGREALL